MSADLRARMREAIRPWFNYFTPGPDPKPSYPERIAGATDGALAAVQSELDAKDVEIGRLTIGHESLKQASIEALERAEQAEAELARSKDVAIRKAEQVRSERNRYAQRADQAEALADEHAANARELGERLRQAEAERDRLRAQRDKARLAIRAAAELLDNADWNEQLVDTQRLAETLGEVDQFCPKCWRLHGLWCAPYGGPMSMPAALGQAPAAEQDGGGE